MQKGKAIDRLSFFAGILFSNIASEIIPLGSNLHFHTIVQGFKMLLAAVNFKLRRQFKWRSKQLSARNKARDAEQIMI